MLLTNTMLQKLFVKYNNSITISPPVERLFSIERNLLKLKQSGLSDQAPVFEGVLLYGVTNCHKFYEFLEKNIS